MIRIRKRQRQSLIRIAAAAALTGALMLGGLSSAGAQAPRLMAPPLSADGTLSFADLVERVSPSVVSILVEREVQTPRFPQELEQFFNFRFGQPQPNDEFDGGAQRLQAQGSGFFIDAEGHIVTNNHVVDGADTIKVRLADGEEIDAELIGADELTDLAVLKVKARPDQPYVEFADDVSLRVGDWVVAVGNPFGLGGTVTSGIVSAIGGQNRELQFTDFIQIDAPINRGNSGGPTFDLKGRVVGVNTAIFSPNGGSVGIGFAIPARLAKQTVSQLIANGSVTRGWLGVQLQAVTTELAAAIGLKDAKGVLIAQVLPDTPAQQAGLQDGDVIFDIGGQAVDDTFELSRIVASYPPGERVRLKVMRDGKARNVTVTLGKRDEDSQVVQVEPANDNDTLSALGMRVTELTGEARARFRVPDDVTGVIVTAVRPGSAADQAGLQPGFVILELDGENISSPSELRAKIDNAKKADKDAVLMRMQIGANRQFGALSLGDE